jgi:hypothetical protein
MCHVATKQWPPSTSTYYTTAAFSCHVTVFTTKLLIQSSSQHRRANISRNVNAVHLDLYCHMYGVTVNVGLMIRFNGLLDTARDYTLQFTVTRARAHTPVSTVTSSLPFLLAASNSGCSPSSGFPNCPRPQLLASNSNSSLQMNSKQSSDSLTHQPTTLFTNSSS